MTSLMAAQFAELDVHNRSSNSGRTSPHKEIEIVPFDGPSAGGGGGGGGNLPCEFLASGCSNLPTNRFN